MSRYFISTLKSEVFIHIGVVILGAEAAYKKDFNISKITLRGSKWGNEFVGRKNFHVKIWRSLASNIERNLFLSITLNVQFEFYTVNELVKYLEIQGNNKNYKNNTQFKLVDI